MNTMATRTTAIMVDGGYYKKRAEAIWGKKSAKARAEELYKYCFLHLTKPEEPRDLYRIFYYDCPGMTRTIKHPLTGEIIDFSSGSGTQWTNEFFKSLASKRKLALRKGELAESQAQYILNKQAVEALLSGKKTISDLEKSDFKLDVKQKGVDMRIGLDVASICYGTHVNQIILIAGDSDFLPVVKMARRSGIDFILDPMGQQIKTNLSEHVDGLESYTKEIFCEQVDDV